MGAQGEEIAEGPGPAEEQPATNCGYYLRQRHNLIRRHVETIDLNPDHTARWQLRIDFELPTDPEACWGRREDAEECEDECHFLFPLVYLKKADTRTGFEVRDEDGSVLPVPTREECDEISSLAAAEAARSLLAERSPPGPSIQLGALAKVLKPIAAELPFESSMALQELRRQFMPNATDSEEAEKLRAEIARTWEQNGLIEVLGMLVEHSLIWIPLRGRPGERRTILVSQRMTLERRAFVRWSFGQMKLPRLPRLQRIKLKRATNPPPEQVLTIGNKTYGRRSRRVSFSALAERIGQPLAWTPYEFELPTIYTKRCESYHFELHCPPDRSPRDLRPANGHPLAEPTDRQIAGIDGDEGRTTLTSRVARHDRPGGDLSSDIWFRVSVGVGSGAFPVLWFLAGAITAAMLWVLAGREPTLESSQAEIAAGILLVVPALVAALVIGGDSSTTRSIGGARLLLLMTGLSAVAAAAVVAGARPFGMERSWLWSICAIVATVATIPLGTGWLLSSSFIWAQLKKLKSRDRQQDALMVVVVLAVVGMVGLIVLGDATFADEAIAVYLLVLCIGINALASNRVAMPIGESRRYVAFSLLVAGVTCLALACIELRAAIDPGQGPQLGVEVGALLILSLSPYAGDLLSWITGRAAPKEDEVHVSPRVGGALLTKETIRELVTLLKREREAEEAKGGSGAGSGNDLAANLVDGLQADPQERIA